MLNVCVIGSSGFIGRALATSILNSQSFNLSCVGNINDTLFSGGVRYYGISEISDVFHWEQILQGVNVVIFTLGIAHVGVPSSKAEILRIRSVNVDSILNVASLAETAGVDRIIFVSSANVCAGSYAGRPLTESDPVAPDGFFADLKLEVETNLFELAKRTGIDVVIIRPPLVYGPGAKGNFETLTKLVAKGLPLPLGAVNNERSLVSLDNLVDLIISCIDHPAAVNQVFFAGDGQDLSTTDFLHGIAIAMGRPAKLIPVPQSILMFFFILFGKRSFASRLLGSMQLDISKARNLLGWEPPVSVAEGLRRSFQSQGK